MAKVGYARVSTKDQSLDIQIAQLKAEGCEVIFQEQVSGSKRDRPELQAMLKYVRRGDTVICCKLDRVARSIKDLWDIVDGLYEKGVGFQALNNRDLDTTSATGRMMLSILGAVAQFEREMLLERQAEGIEAAKLKGVYVGRQPTAKRQAEQVLNMLATGFTKQQVADKLKIGKSSVYRIAAEHNQKGGGEIQIKGEV